MMTILKRQSYSLIMCYNRNIYHDSDQAIIYKTYILFITIMVKISRPIGFIIGFGLGMYTRDNFIYPYPIRVQDLQTDYTTINKSIQQRNSQLKATVQKMRMDLQVQQGVYVATKHQIMLNEDQEQTKASKNNNKQSVNSKQGVKGKTQKK